MTQMKFLYKLTGQPAEAIRKQLGELAAGLAAVRKGQLTLAASNGKTR